MTPSSTPDDDVRLAHAIAQGDESALARAYDTYGSLVYGLALRVCGKVHDAEEVLQDVFLTLWRTASRFDGARGSLAGYLTTLTRNRAIDRLRSRRARPDAALGMDDDTPPIAAEVESPSDRAGVGEGAALAIGALTRLPADERRVLEMAYFDGLSQSEIAARTGDPLGTVKGRTRNALRRLRESLPRSLGGVQ